MAPSFPVYPVAAKMPPRIRVVMLDLMAIVPYYTAHLCASLERIEGTQVALASVTYQHDPECFRRHGVHNDPGFLDVAFRLRHMPAWMRRPLKVAEYLANMSALVVRLMLSRPDVIHVQFLPLASYGMPVELWFLRLARSLGIEVVYTVHNVLPQDSGSRHASAYGLLYRLADRLVCHDSVAAARLHTEFQVAPERITVIPHGPLFEHGRSASAGPARAKLGFAPDECIVLWQGILEPYKGVSFLLKAWQRVCAAERRALLAIVGTGDGGFVGAIKREVIALGIQSRVRLDPRFVSVQELADLYDAADVLVYPYSEITTSGALMTGIVRGKAIVASALPAFEQILKDGETALLVRYGDVDALASSLLRLIRDPDLRRVLGERLRAGQTQAPRWPEIARQTCECYSAALSAHARWSGQAAKI